MLKKTIRRLGALAMVLAMAVSVFAVNASAAEGAEVTYTTIGSFTKKVTTDGNTFAPNTTFKYTVKGAAAGSATVKNSDNTETKIEYYAGKDGDIVFTNTAFTPSSSVSSEYTANGDIQMKAGAYTNPGIYHYTVQEEDGKYDGIIYDTAIRHVFVYVVNGDNNTVKVENILITNGNFEKVDGTFTNNYGSGENNSTHDVTIKKTLEGNMADATKEFNFDVIVTPADGAKEKYKVELDGKEIYPLVVSDNGVAQMTYKLKGGHNVKIYGLSTNDVVSVTEQEANSDGYTTTTTYTNFSAENGKATADGAVIDVKNAKHNATPGGVIMTIAPYALMVVLAGAFAVVFLTRRNRAE